MDGGCAACNHGHDCVRLLTNGNYVQIGPIMGPTRLSMPKGRQVGSSPQMSLLHNVESGHVSKQEQGYVIEGVEHRAKQRGCASCVNQHFFLL